MSVEVVQSLVEEAGSFAVGTGAAGGRSAVEFALFRYV